MRPLATAGAAGLMFLAAAAPGRGQICPASIQFGHQGSELHIDIGYAESNPDSAAIAATSPGFSVFRDGNPPQPVQTELRKEPTPGSMMLSDMQAHPDEGPGAMIAYAGIIPFPHDDPSLGFTFSHPPAGASNLPLAKIMFSEGPPDQQGWLAPAEGEAWNFAADGDENVWISCGYGTSGLLLSQKLRPAIKSCKVSTSAGNPGVPVVDCATK